MAMDGTKGSKEKIEIPPPRTTNYINPQYGDRAMRTKILENYETKALNL
jgi:hypothetical protein